MTTRQHDAIEVGGRSHAPLIKPIGIDDRIVSAAHRGQRRIDARAGIWLITLCQSEIGTERRQHDVGEPGLRQCLGRQQSERANLPDQRIVRPRRHIRPASGRIRFGMPGYKDVERPRQALALQPPRDLERNESADAVPEQHDGQIDEIAQINDNRVDEHGHVVDRRLTMAGATTRRVRSPDLQPTRQLARPGSIGVRPATAVRETDQPAPWLGARFQAD